MAQHGGKRKGAGRKKAQHTIETETMRKVLIETVSRNMQALLEAQLDLALGVRVQDEDGGPVYHRAPSNDAIQYLLNQSIGKPKESLNVSGKLTIAQLLKRLNDADSSGQDVEDESPLSD